MREAGRGKSIRYNWPLDFILEIGEILLKLFFIPAISLALLLGACQGSVPSRTETAPSPTALAYAATQPAGDSAGQVTDPAAAGTQAPGTSGTSAGCTVVSPQPTPGPTEQSIFPPVSDQDWMLGPQMASITIIEYGDFQ
jgi:hypothetical protein